MPILPSGRRIEFSLDRFHAMLEMLPQSHSMELGTALRAPADLLWVLDLVVFDANERACFAECLAAEWDALAREWPLADQEALAAHIKSDEFHFAMSRGIEGTHKLILDRLPATEAHAGTGLRTA